jgi:hypothetical protein
MKIAKFTYKKEDNTESQRELYNAYFVKEATNTLKDFEKPDIKYIKGIEFKKEGLSEEEIKKYEDAIQDFYETAPTLSEFLVKEGLDATRVSADKTFKKTGVSGMLLTEMREV